MIATREHGSIGQNVKVHFAGAENVDFAYVMHDAGVNYWLYFEAGPRLGEEVNQCQRVRSASPSVMQKAAS